MRLLRAATPFFLLAVVLAPASRAESRPSTEKLGTRIADFQVQDSAGKPFHLADLKDAKAVVVVFLNFDCPVCTSYAPVLAEMAKAYADKGVAFLGVCAAGDEDLAEMAKQARQYKLSFPVYRDSTHAAAGALKATVTPEAFLLDKDRTLRYRGRIDDGYQARLKKNVQISHHDLRRALDEILAGKDVTDPATEAVGCAIRVDRVVKKDGAVTYHRDVEPILQSHCQECHRTGAVGPFALMTYKQAVNWAGDIKDFTASRKMPPWKPAEGGPFHNERKLTEREIATLAAWVDGETPEGDPKDAPPPRQFVEGWRMGQPDLVLTMSDDFTLGPTGPDVFRCMVLPTNLTEDRYVVAVEVRPGNPRILHHTLNFIDARGRARKLEEKERSRPRKEDELDGGPGYSAGMGGVGFATDGGLGGWAPGQLGKRTPPGSAMFLPRGSDVVVQMHYHRNGRLEKDRTQIGLYFAKEPVQRRVKGMVLAGNGPLWRMLRIPAGADNYRVAGTVWVEADCDIYDIMPHMHMVGHKIKVSMTPPGEETRTLVAIDDWDYNWQETYFFKEPIHVKAGTRFDVEAFYDNSTKNPNNPNQVPKAVRFGEQTTDEMCFVFMSGISDRPGRIPQTFLPPRQEKKKEAGKADEPKREEPRKP